MNAHAEQSQPAAEVVSRQLVATLIALARTAGAAGSGPAYVVADPFDTLAELLQQLVAAMSSQHCDDGSSVSEMDVFVSPNRAWPPHHRCRHSPPHCYDLNYQLLPNCP